ncbi:hypothetical protein T492DRAFT_993466 [Pavlovales sp. CCMP2436]|nr:hypothetical protein T492DRAFT_993466 [Pavlovales sp. CCMP2436]
MQIAISIDAGEGPPESVAPPPKGGAAKADKAKAEAAAAATAAAAAAGVPLTPLTGTSFCCACGIGLNGAPIEAAVTHALGAPDALSTSTVTLRLTSELVQAYAKRGQGLTLTLLGPAGEVLGSFTVDMMPLVRGEATASSRWHAFPQEQDEQLIPAATAVWVRRLAVTVGVDPGAGTDFLGPELGAVLNPMTVELLRAEDLPSAYSGNPTAGGPFEDLMRCCRPVVVQWKLPLGAGAFRSSERPHARKITFGEKQTIFAGLLDGAAFSQALCSHPIEIELRDRDPLARPRRAFGDIPAEDGAVVAEEEEVSSFDLSPSTLA